MSNNLEDLKKRNLKVREIYNKYKLGMHPFLTNPDPSIYRPSEDDSSMDLGLKDGKSANTGSPTGSESKSFNKLSTDEDAKTETSQRKRYYDDFEYNDVLDDCFCKPFLDDEDWISSSEESEEESKRNKSERLRQANASEDAKGLSDFSNEKDKHGLDDSSSEGEESKEVNPEKINWFKYIFKNHVKPDDEMHETLNSPTVTQTILSILLSDKGNDQIQEELFENIGFEKIDMITELISKREYIQGYCEVLSKEINREKKNQNTGHNPYQYSTGVTVTYNNNRKGKKGKGKQKQNKGKAQVSNHELLGKLGFSDEFIEENYLLGLKPRNQNNADYKGFVTSETKRRAQVFTAHADGRKAGYKQDYFDEPDWKEVHLTPPKRGESIQHELKPIKSLARWMRPAFSSTENLNTIQSLVFESAFNSTNNILVAAPTGAGKTNIALLTILREVKKYVVVKPGNPN